MIVIIDSGLSNIKSVANALDILGAEVVVSSNKDDLRRAERIILPGVGAFSEGMELLRKLDLIDTLREEVLVKKKPFLGICLGMQLLATRGFEGGVNKGLGFIPGEVRHLEPNDATLKIPHMGWDNISVKKEHPLLMGMKKDKDFYFVHSYHFVPDSKEHILATFDYGGEFVAAISKDNIIATQFHPEKSQQNGLRILEKFIEWNPNPLSEKDEKTRGGRC